MPESRGVITSGSFSDENCGGSTPRHGKAFRSTGRWLDEDIGGHLDSFTESATLPPVISGDKQRKRHDIG